MRTAMPSTVVEELARRLDPSCPERSSPHSLYEKRLLKYASNLGFAVAVPGLDLARTKPQLVRGAYAAPRRVSREIPGRDRLG